MAVIVMMTGIFCNDYIMKHTYLQQLYGVIQDCLFGGRIRENVHTDNMNLKMVDLPWSGK